MGGVRICFLFSFCLVCPNNKNTDTTDNGRSILRRCLLLLDAALALMPGLCPHQSIDPARHPSIPCNRISGL